MSTLVIDLDGTLCAQGDGSFAAYEGAAPKQAVIDKCNELYDKGWRVIVWTARGMNRYSGDVDQVYAFMYDMTEKWLRDHGVKYHELLMGKPSTTVYVDDKAMRPEEFIVKY